MSVALPSVLLKSAIYVSYVARTNVSMCTTNILHIDLDTLQKLMCTITIGFIVVAIKECLQ